MMLFLKRAGFLLLMAVLGVFSLVLHSSGYPFAWRFSTNEPYWLPVAYGFNLLCLVAALGLLFWSLRSFLFGRGRPWLAGVSLAGWVLVWSAAIWHDVGARTAVWNFSLIAGTPSLTSKVQALTEQTWSLGAIKDLPEALRQSVCSKAVLSEESRVVADREGFPMTQLFPAEMADKGLFEADACPADLARQYKQLSSLTAQLKATVAEDQAGSEYGQRIDTLRNMSAQAALIGHPDSIVAMSDLFKKHKDQPIEKEIALKTHQLRLHTNGQVRDHTWQELDGYAGERLRHAYFDPRIWDANHEPGQDLWHYWSKIEFTDGRVVQTLWVADCRTKTNAAKLEIVQRGDATLRLEPVLGEPEPVRKGMLGEELLNLACASKDHQVRLPDDVAARKFGS